MCPDGNSLWNILNYQRKQLSLLILFKKATNENELVVHMSYLVTIKEDLRTTHRIVITIRLLDCYNYMVTIKEILRTWPSNRVMFWNELVCYWRFRCSRYMVSILCLLITGFLSTTNSVNIYEDLNQFLQNISSYS